MKAVFPVNGLGTRFLPATKGRSEQVPIFMTATGKNVPNT